MTLTEQIKNEILKAIEEKKPLDPIYKKYKGSKGPLYNALARAFAAVVSWIEQARSKLNETISEESKAKASLQATVGRKKEIEEETRNAERRCAELHQTERKYEKSIEEVSKRLGGLEQDYREKKCKKEADLQSALKSLKSELDRTRFEIAALNEEASKRGLSPEEALDSLRKLGDLRQEFRRLCVMVEGKKKELDRIIRGRKEEDDDTASKRKELSRRWDETIEMKKRRGDELDQRIKKRIEQEGRLKRGLKHGVGVEFFETLYNLDSEDRLTVLKYGIAACTPQELEALYFSDLNRRLRSELLRIQRGMVKDLVKEVQ